MMGPLWPAARAPNAYAWSERSSGFAVKPMRGHALQLNGDVAGPGRRCIGVYRDQCRSGRHDGECFGDGF